MTNGWTQTEELAKKHAAQGGKYASLKNDGEYIVGKFCGEPHAREVFWDGSKYVDSKPEGGNAKASLRISVNFFVVADGEMKILELNTATFNSLIAVRDKYGLDKWTFEIKRYGKKGDTKTKYTLLPEKEVDASLRATIAQAPLHDLTSEGGESEGGAAEEAPASKTIDIDTAKTLMERLKSLPRAEADAFIAEFKIARIRDLLSSDVPAANRFIAEREAKHRPAAPAEVDPFA